MFRTRIAWRIRVVECYSIKTVALLGSGDRDEYGEKCKDRLKGELPGHMRQKTVDSWTQIREAIRLGRFVAIDRVEQVM